MAMIEQHLASGTDLVFSLGDFKEKIELFSLLRPTKLIFRDLSKHCEDPKEPKTVKIAVLGNFENNLSEIMDLQKPEQI